MRAESLAGRADPRIVFAGGFETGTYKPWSTPECANYAQPANPLYSFGTFFPQRSRVGQGSFAGRFDLPTDGSRLTRCEVATRRGINAGGDDFYSLMVYLPYGWSTGTEGFWGVEIAQLNFQGYWGPTVGLQAHTDHITLAVQSGVCANRHCEYSSNADSPGKQRLPPLYRSPGRWCSACGTNWSSTSIGPPTRPGRSRRGIV